MGVCDRTVVLYAVKDGALSTAEGRDAVDAMIGTSRRTCT